MKTTTSKGTGLIDQSQNSTNISSR